jgi:hypothetical protein
MHADAPEERPKGGERSSTTWCPNDGCAPPGARGSDSDCSQPCLRLRAPDVPPWQATKHLDAEVARRYLPREVFFTFVFAFFAGFASLPSGDGVALTFFLAGTSFNPSRCSSWLVDCAWGRGRRTVTHGLHYLGRLSKNLHTQRTTLNLRRTICQLTAVPIAGAAVHLRSITCRAGRLGRCIRHCLSTDSESCTRRVTVTGSGFRWTKGSGQPGAPSVGSPLCSRRAYLSFGACSWSHSC